MSGKNTGAARRKPRTSDVPSAAGAIRTAYRILDAWGATPEQQQAILGLSRRSYYGWKRRPPDQPDRDKLERVSYVLGIWKALRTLFPSGGAWRRWPQLPNGAPLFGGAPPIELMAGGQVADLYRVRQLLDAWRGWN